jgi:hypothetical protein
MPAQQTYHFIKSWGVNVFILLILFHLPFINVSAQETKGLELWIGKYPFDKIRGRTFFQTADSVLSLRKKLPRNEYNLLTEGNYLQTPIIKIDSFLVTSRCRPHCCPCENVWIAVRINSEKYLIAFQNQSTSTGHLVHCYSVGMQLAQIPDSLKESFLETFIPRMNSGDHLYDENHWIDTIKKQ